MFVTHLAAPGVTHKSIKCYLSAIRHLQIAATGSEPQISSMISLDYVLQGIKRAQAAPGHTAPRRRLLITAAIMRSLRRSWEAQGASFDCGLHVAHVFTVFYDLGRPRSLRSQLTIQTYISRCPTCHSIRQPIPEPSSPLWLVSQICSFKTLNTSSRSWPKYNWTQRKVL